ncbi:zinc finger protein 454-like [Anabrus simplex]|uniref:zinc finger protein 454-like n=1 Tax=Anabrus simplex TaxID=316456 RepID=UPI0035A3558E
MNDINKLQREMDLEVKIKEEPAWLEGTTTASLENFEHVSEVIALKEEVKSELTEPESSQEDSLEPSEDIKEEIFVEEHTDDQPLPYVKEETKSRPEVSYGDHQSPDGGSPCYRCNLCGIFLPGKLGLLQHLERHKDDHPFKCNHCEKLFDSGSSLSEHLRIHPLLVCGCRNKCFTEMNMLTDQMQLHTVTVAPKFSVTVPNFHLRPHRVNLRELPARGIGPPRSGRDSVQTASFGTIMLGIGLEAGFRAPTLSLARTMLFGTL